MQEKLPRAAREEAPPARRGEMRTRSARGMIRGEATPRGEGRSTPRVAGGLGRRGMTRGEATPRGDAHPLGKGYDKGRSDPARRGKKQPFGQPRRARLSPARSRAARPRHFRPPAPAPPAGRASLPPAAAPPARAGRATLARPHPRRPPAPLGRPRRPRLFPARTRAARPAQRGGRSAPARRGQRRRRAARGRASAVFAAPLRRANRRVRLTAAAPGALEKCNRAGNCAAPGVTVDFHFMIYSFGRGGEGCGGNSRAPERDTSSMQFIIDFIMITAMKGRLAQRNLDVDSSGR